MNLIAKLTIVFLIIVSFFFIKDNFFTQTNDETPVPQEEVSNIMTPNDKDNIEKEIKKEEMTKPLITLYFTNENNGELKPCTRDLPSTQAKLNYAITELLKGPTSKEIKNGISSEIPKGTKLLAIKDAGSYLILDLSDNFQYGGGTQSQYTRLKQIIKTVLNVKLDKPVYLYLNGEKAEVIGGEGIILNQPLSETSLDN